MVGSGRLECTLTWSKTDSGGYPAQALSDAHGPVAIPCPRDRQLFRFYLNELIKQRFGVDGSFFFSEEATGAQRWTWRFDLAVALGCEPADMIMHLAHTLNTCERDIHTISGTLKSWTRRRRYPPNYAKPLEGWACATHNFSLP